SRQPDGDRRLRPAKWYVRRVLSRQLLDHAVRVNHWEKGQMSLDPASGLLVTTSIRAMIWDTPPTNGAAPVSAIQGQPDATSAGTVPTSPTSISAFCSAVS